MKDGGATRETFYSAEKQIERFQTRLMSNARWRDFFPAVAGADPGSSYSGWKLVAEEHTWAHRMPRGLDLRGTHFADGHFQPFEYRYVEWIFIPRRYKPYPGVGLAREQDVDGLVEALERTGKRFPFEVDARGFTIFGYK